MHGKQCVRFWCFSTVLCIVCAEFRSHDGFRHHRVSISIGEVQLLMHSVLFVFLMWSVALRRKRSQAKLHSHPTFQASVMGWVECILLEHCLHLRKLCCPPVLPYKEPIKRALLLKLGRLSVCSTRTCPKWQTHTHCCGASHNCRAVCCRVASVLAGRSPACRLVHFQQNLAH